MVKRLEIEVDRFGGYEACESPIGDFVHYKDHAAVRVERDALAAQLTVLLVAYEECRITGLADILESAFSKITPYEQLVELRAQAIEEAADHFVEQGEASVEELQEFAEIIRKGGAA